jgi:hypothetical protein
VKAWAALRPASVESRFEALRASGLTELFSCTGVASVTNAHRGALLQVFARTVLGDIAISDQVMTLNTNIVVPVSPLLAVGTEVFVRQWACSEMSAASKREPVVIHPQPGPTETLGPIVQRSFSTPTRWCLRPQGTDAR